MTLTAIGSSISLILLTGIPHMGNPGLNKLAVRRFRDDDTWYINSQGQRMVVLGPAEFLVGSPQTEKGRVGDSEVLHRRRIDRRFALATTEVTVEQFHRFVEEEGIQFEYKTEYTCPGGPQTGITWFRAVRYCNWLSEKEGIPTDQWCYQPNREGNYHLGMKPKDGYMNLRGYRLPSVAEWEYACRAGSVTSRYFGETDELLAYYAWYRSNSDRRAHPVGSLKPNEFGLFDMHGNVFEWCHNLFEKYPEEMAVTRDKGDASVVLFRGNKDERCQRGGAFLSYSSLVRSALRYTQPPAQKFAQAGFRVARTNAASNQS